MNRYLILFGLLIPSLAIAKPLYSCTNSTAEIQCTNNTCQILNQPNFTPAQIDVSKNNQVSICMYSDCWEAKVKPILINNNVIYSAENFHSNTHNKTSSFILNIRPKTKLGFLQGDHFLLPLQCK